MLRTIGRVLALSALAVTVAMGLAHSPAPAVTAVAWLLFAYLLRAAWSTICADARRLRQLRLPGMPKMGRHAKSYDGGSL